MSARRLLLFGGGGGKTYIRKVRTICGPSLLAYWPLNETTGTVAYDHSGNDHHGTYIGVDLGQPGLFGPCPYFDGVNDYVNMYSLALRNAFPQQEGTMFAWVWDYDIEDRNTEGTVQACWRQDSNNRVQFGQRTYASSRIIYSFSPLPPIDGITLAANDVIGWNFYALGYSVASQRYWAYAHSSRSGASYLEERTTTDWAGFAWRPDVITFGYYNSAPRFRGLASHYGYCSRSLSATELAALSNPRG